MHDAVMQWDLLLICEETHFLPESDIMSKSDYFSCLQNKPECFYKIWLNYFIMASSSKVK